MKFAALILAVVFCGCAAIGDKVREVTDGNVNPTAITIRIGTT